MAIAVSYLGSNADVSKPVFEKLEPDFQVVHAFFSLEKALAEIPALITATGQKSIGAVFLGGHLPPTAHEQVRTAVHAVDPSVRIVSVTKEDVMATGGSGPDPAVIADLYRQKWAVLEAEAGRAVA